MLTFDSILLEQCVRNILEKADKYPTLLDCSIAAFRRLVIMDYYSRIRKVI